MDRCLQIAALLVGMLAIARSDGDCDKCTCPNPVVMSCGTDQLTQPPAGYWPNIEVLDMWGNDISVIYNNSFTGFPNAKHVDLGSNKLFELNLEAFAKMPLLDTLLPANNFIRTIIPPSKGVYLQNLWSLNLNKNRVSWLDPNAFKAAPNLETLKLEDNPIVIPDGVSFLNHPSLLQLYIEGLNMANLSPKTLEGLPKILILTMKSTAVTDISGVFTNHKWLARLYLGNNSITEVTAGTFAPTENLQELVLSGNPLQRLDVSALEDAVAYRAELDISDTPLACSCDYAALYWWARGRQLALRASCGGEPPCSFTRQGN